MGLLVVTGEVAVRLEMAEVHAELPIAGVEIAVAIHDERATAAAGDDAALAEEGGGREQQAEETAEEGEPRGGFAQESRGLHGVRKSSPGRGRVGSPGEAPLVGI